MVADGSGSAATGDKRTLYVGGLADEVTAETLNAAFVPFGDVRDVQLPMDYAQGKHRGFGFVEFVEAEDAAAAVDNMDNAELFGRVLRVNVAANKRLRSEALWSATEDQTWEERRRDEAQVAAAKAARQP